MRRVVPFVRMFLSGLAIALVVSSQTLSQTPQRSVCKLVIHEERLELEETQLALSLARSDFAAYEKIFKLIEELWKGDAIERMAYIETKYNRDAAKLTLDRAALSVERQQALIEVYGLACDSSASAATSRAAERLRRHYQKAHCDSLAAAVEAAAVRLEFDRELLTSVLDLREGQVATRPDVILAELRVEKEEKRLRDAKIRVEACRRELGRQEKATVPDGAD